MCSILEKFRYRNSLWIRAGGGESKFSVEKFCLTLPKFFVEEHFHVSLISGTEKVWIRGGSIKFFRRKFFVSQSRNFP